MIMKNVWTAAGKPEPVKFQAFGAPDSTLGVTVPHASCIQWSGGHNRNKSQFQACQRFAAKARPLCEGFTTLTYFR